MLTKRPENIPAMVPENWLANGFPDNVWLGVTAENQEEANQRIPHLLQLPARVRFLSCEPLLGPINVKEAISQAKAINNHPLDAPKNTIHWVIAGGESGPKARPSHPGWFTKLLTECQELGAAFFFKQWGTWAPWYTINPDENQAAYQKMLKAGVTLTHNATPINMLKPSRYHMPKYLGSQPFLEIPHYPYEVVTKV